MLLLGTCRGSGNVSRERLSEPPLFRSTRLTGVGGGQVVDRSSDHDRPAPRGAWAFTVHLPCAPCGLGRSGAGRPWWAVQAVARLPSRPRRGVRFTLSASTAGSAADLDRPADHHPEAHPQVVDLRSVASWDSSGRSTADALQMQTRLADARSSGAGGSGPVGAAQPPPEDPGAQPPPGGSGEASGSSSKSSSGVSM